MIHTNTFTTTATTVWSTNKQITGWTRTPTLYRKCNNNYSEKSFSWIDSQRICKWKHSRSKHRRTTSSRNNNGTEGDINEHFLILVIVLHNSKPDYILSLITSFFGLALIIVLLKAHLQSFHGLFENAPLASSTLYTFSCQLQIEKRFRCFCWHSSSCSQACMQFENIQE